VDLERRPATPLLLAHPGHGQSICARGKHDKDAINRNTARPDGHRYHVKQGTAMARSAKSYNAEYLRPGIGTWMLGTDKNVTRAPAAPRPELAGTHTTADSAGTPQGVMGWLDHCIPKTVFPLPPAFILRISITPSLHDGAVIPQHDTAPLYYHPTRTSRTFLCLTGKAFTSGTFPCWHPMFLGSSGPMHPWSP
jgi:hypothetical protein